MAERALIDETVDKIVQCFEFGFMCSVLTGSAENLQKTRESLFEKLLSKSYSVNLIDLYKDSVSFEINGDKPIVFVWGLENLAPTQDASYTVRTFLDVEKHSGLVSVIFCEAGSYEAHFNDQNSPFYLFAARLSVDPN